MSNVIPFIRPQQAPAQAEAAQRSAPEDASREKVFAILFGLLQHVFETSPQWVSDAIAELYFHDGIDVAEYNIIMGHFYPRGAA